jgi:hypothetical protein
VIKAIDGDIILMETGEAKTEIEVARWSVLGIDRGRPSREGRVAVQFVTLLSMLASVGEGRVVYAVGIRGTVTEIRRDSVIIETGPRRAILDIDKSYVEFVE